MAEYKQLLSRAAKICSSGEKCRHDIREKLISWGMADEEIETALEFLVKNKFIDEERYTRFFVRDKLRFNKWGRIKISYMLRQKNIEGKMISAALENLDPEEYNSILCQILETKKKSIGNTNTQANKAKILRFAAQKGFTSEEIFTCLNRIENDSDN